MLRGGGEEDWEAWALRARLHSRLDRGFLGKVPFEAAAGALAGLGALPAPPRRPAEGEAFEAALAAAEANFGSEAVKDSLRRLLATPGDGPPRLVLGPVVGKVTDSTARILVESSHDAAVTCTLTPEDGAPPVAQRLQLPRGRPTVFRFERLAAGQLHQVHFEGAQMLTEGCSFRTLPTAGWRLAEGHAPKLAVASCNSVYVSREQPHDAPGNLWHHLKTQLKAGDRLDYFLHLGDNVYNDLEWHQVEKGKGGLEGYACKWGIAYLWLRGLPRERWPEHEAAVEELFRTIYRETWGYPPQRFVMAHVPNLMVYDDHEVRDDWGDRPEDADKDSLDTFLARIAYRLIREYQYQLHRDLDQEQGCDYHLHVLGDVALAFLDLRGCKTFHRTGMDEVSPMLGVDQWRRLEDALLAEDGVFSACKALLLLSPQPVAYLSHKPTVFAGLTLVDDVLGAWSAPKHAAEAPRLMKALTAWRSKQEGRALLVVGGDVHEGGWTDIRVANLDALVDEASTVRQLTTSAMANRISSQATALAVALARDVGGLMDGFSICGGWRFQHYDWTHHRNYALLDIAAAASKVEICGRLVASGGDGVELRARHSTADPTPSFASRFGLAVKDVTGNVGHSHSKCCTLL